MISTFPSRAYNIEHYPAVKEHLLSYGFDRLDQSGEQNARKKTNNKWFETQDSINYWEDFFRPKMLWAETMRIHRNKDERFPRFSYDNSGMMTDKTCFFATGEKIKYILAILNSNVGRYLCSQYVSILDNGGYLMQKVYLESIPVKVASLEVETHISELVDKTLIQKANNLHTTDLENEIDSIVYQMYNLTKEEIQFIENQILQPFR